MAEKGFTGQGFLWRLLFALLLVGATYNLEDDLYYHWALTDFSIFGREQTVVGILLADWVGDLLTCNASFTRAAGAYLGDRAAPHWCG